MLASLLEGKRVVVCCGAGGVGKTTVSAALGLAAAREGLRTVVLTIDPAKRLANALGLDHLPAEPTALPREMLDRAAVPKHGSLHALMLDPKETFDALVGKLSSEEAAKRIRRNRLYQHLCEMLAGLQEYTAEEKLHELALDPRFDLVVVDTPPSRNALDFLEAPGRIVRFFDERVLKWFAAQRAPRRGFGILARTSRLLYGVIGKIFGESFADEISEFLEALDTMTATFRKHAEEVRTLLASSDASFLLVTTPERASMNDALFFRQRLREMGLPFGGYIVNRVHPERAEPTAEDFRATETAIATETSETQAKSLFSRVASSYAGERARGLHDREAIRRLSLEGSDPIAAIPVFYETIADILGLAAFADQAFYVAPQR